ncbi:MAG: Alkyl hydroperoxide reductase subunit C-like protein [Microbacteriaceae bacterium]|nr:Alkyl hydroperoxide reductase subunit C-like protein [Microbacteriaceae bacterium]
MALETGSTLSLKLRNSDGTPFALEDYRGRDNVFVYFMRTISCAQCNSAVRTLASQRAQLESEGVKVVVAVPDDAADALAWKAKRDVPFPVVIGQDGTAHAEAGLLRKVFGAIQQSGGVLIDKQGVVRYSHVSTNPGASYQKADLAAAVAALA